MNIKPEFSQLPARLLDRLFGTAGRQRLSILIYHRVLEGEDYLRPGDPTAMQFDWQMSLISRHCHPLSLSEALRLMDAGELPDRAVCVTFDDGYSDNASVALPIFQKWDVPATIFVSTSFLDGGRMWNDTVLETVRTTKTDNIDLSKIRLGVFPIGEQPIRRKSAHDILEVIKHLPPLERQEAVNLVAEQSTELPDNLMLTTERLKKLHNEGVEIGAHTHTHPILSSLNPDEARQEMATSKNLLEDILGDTVRFFAYPNGRLGSDYERIHRDMIYEMGFEAALSTHWGVASRATDRWQMPRFTPWDATPQRFLVRLLWNQRNVIE